MNTRYLFLFLLPVLFCCCKKKGSSGPVNIATPDNGEFAYTVRYDEVISMTPNSAYNFVFNIKVTKGYIVNNKLTCSLNDLPAYMNVTPESQEVAQLLGGVFTISVGNVALGNYPLHLNITSAKNGTESHDVLLKIVPPFDYAPYLAGTYDSSYDFCRPGGSRYEYTALVTKVTDTPYLMKIYNIKGLGSPFMIRAWVSNVITIPVQTVDGYTIWGSGTYSEDARAGHSGQLLMSINDTMVHGLDTEACTAHIQH